MQGDNRDDELQTLRGENAHLLQELAMAYQQMEKVLHLAGHETHVAYDELRKRNDQLQAQLTELRLAHEQLRDTQRMLLRAERMSAMGQMAAAIVHEINSPLSVVVGQAEMILMKEGEPVDPTDVQMIIEAAHRLGRLTRNVLRFSRRSTSEFLDVDLNQIVTETLEFLSPLMKQVTVTSDLTFELPAVQAYPAQMEQVLTNLLTNAMDALSDRGSGRIHVSTGTSTIPALIESETAGGRQVRLAIGKDVAPGDHVYMQVSDDGPGIDATELDSIFEAFFSTKDEDHGTGLGLAISRKIAEDHEGDILVATGAGTGTSFRLLLPVERTLEPGENDSSHPVR